MADWNGRALRRGLVSAERFNDRAILFGSFHVNTPPSRSRALLSFVTLPDQYFFFIAEEIFETVFDLLRYLQDKEDLSLSFIVDFIHH